MYRRIGKSYESVCHTITQTVFNNSMPRFSFLSVFKSLFDMAQKGSAYIHLYVRSVVDKIEKLGFGSLGDMREALQEFGTPRLRIDNGYAYTVFAGLINFYRALWEVLESCLNAGAALFQYLKDFFKYSTRITRLIHPAIRP
jgi:hypothetical protein